MNDGAFSAVAGAKFIFDGGRYKCGNNTAQQMKNVCDITAGIELAEGKEFVDLNNGQPDDDGFMFRVDWKAIELTIGAGRFATFYDDHNVTLAVGTPTGVGLYTIIGMEQDAVTQEVKSVFVDDLTGVVEKETPMLVYNGTGDQLTVKLKATNDQPDAENQYISPLENFQGTAVDNDFTGDDMLAYDYYALSGGKAFAPVYGAGTIAAHKCWLQFPKQQTPGSRSITIVFDNETTGVNEVIEFNEVSDDTLYDLNGRKLNAAPKRKGVYVKDGQKVVVK
jgi:hypothetical protein